VALLGFNQRILFLESPIIAGPGVIRDTIAISAEDLKGLLNQYPKEDLEDIQIHLDKLLENK
jgi:hypothetical protein